MDRLSFFLIIGELHGSFGIERTEPPYLAFALVSLGYENEVASTAFLALESRCKTNRKADTVKIKGRSISG
jgi:hypothetical protein